MIKRLFRLIMVIVVAISCMVTYIYASDYHNEDMDLYAKQTLSGYIKETRPDVTYATISQAFPLYDFDNNCLDSMVYFALNGNNVLGMLNVFESESGYISLYYYDMEESIQTAFRNSEKFVIGVSQDNMLVIKEGENAGLNSTIYNFNAITDTEESLNLQKARSTTILFTRILNVPYVANTSINGKGLCWAACVATNVNYIRGTSYTALDVYNALVSQNNGTPVGNTEWIKKAYQQYGITPTVYDRDTHNPYTLNYTQIYGNLYSNKPIHIGLLRSTGAAHGIVITGITAYYETVISEYYAYYYFRDPSTSSEVCLQVGYDVMLDGTKLEYYSPGNNVVYDDWMRTVELTNIS